MAEAKALRLRLFLEGLEVPVISATIQVAANTPATASIQVVATDKVLELFPRTVVHLFFHDHVAAGNPVLDPKMFESADDGDTASDRDNREYKLLFMGELQAVAFQKGHGNRSAVLSCVDFSNYWDTTFQYNFGGSLFGGRARAAFIGANSNFFTSPLGHGTGDVSRLLSGKSKNFPKLKGLLAGIVRMLEAIGGSYYGKSAFRGCNDFTSIAELRLKVLQQIAAAESDDSSAKLFARKTFNSWMGGKMGSLGQMVSFRGLTKMLFQYIYHECYPCPVAYYTAPSTRRVPTYTSVKLDESLAKDAAVCHAKAQKAVADYATWEKVVSSAKGTTSSGRWTQARNRRGVYHDSFNSLIAAAAALKINIDKAKGGGQGQIKTLWANIKSAQRIIKAHPSEHANLPSNHASLKKRLDKIETLAKSLSGGTVSARKGSKDETVPSRVHNQIFRPDIYFSPPPRCNVLFPELYDQFQFQRNFMREVSRMELQTTNEVLGAHALFNGRYYAPNVADVRSGVKLSAKRYARTIMEHELYTGIIPMFETMSEANIYAMQSGRAQSAAVRDPYAQRAVNYMYFKHRFAARAMTASGRFNPMFIPGLPGLLLDRPLTAAQLTDLPEDATAEQLSKKVGVQYLGVCAGLTHSVTQQGGNTAYQFMHARVHRESTEFLGVDKKEISVLESSTTTVVSASAIKAAGTCAAQADVAIAKLTAWSNVVKVATGTRSQSHWGEAKKRRVVFNSSFKALSGSATSLESADNKGKSTVALQKDIKAAQDIIKAQPVGDAKLPADYVKLRKLLSRVSARAKGLTTGKVVSAKYSKSTVDIPIEEAIAPPWIWKGWKNPHITDTYAEMFGTSSIVGVKTHVGPLTDITTEDEVAELVSGGNTVEGTVDKLVRTYSYARVNDMDMGDYINVYIWRPVATMVDILGASDLSIEKREVSHTVAVKTKHRRIVKGAKDPTLAGLLVGQSIENLPSEIYTKTTSKVVTKSVYEVKGKEGFHSRAFGDKADLFGLVNPTVKRVLGLSRSRKKIASRLDVRARRRAVVRSYVAELLGSGGLLG